MEGNLLNVICHAVFQEVPFPYQLMSGRQRQVGNRLAYRALKCPEDETIAIAGRLVGSDLNLLVIEGRHFQLCIAVQAAGIELLCQLIHLNGVKPAAVGIDGVAVMAMLLIAVQTWVIGGTKQIHRDNTLLCHKAALGIIQKGNTGLMVGQVEPLLAADFKLCLFMFVLVGGRSIQIAILNITVNHVTPMGGLELCPNHIAGILPVEVVGDADARIVAVHHNGLH